MRNVRLQTAFPCGNQMIVLNATFALSCALTQPSDQVCWTEIKPKMHQKHSKLLKLKEAKKFKDYNIP